MGRLSADVVTVSNRHPNHASLADVGGEPTVLDGPGEYEIHGVCVTGVRTSAPSVHGERLYNTSYLISVDDVAVCHLGDLTGLPTTEQIEVLKDAHVLLVPVGGHCTISAAQAAEVVSRLEPRVVVPMHYATEVSTVDLEGVDRFLREMGIPGAEPQQRLNVTRGSLPDEPTVILLQHR
jgi:L-ascorbate metabolism protein UlaG (beta-lactamase superfamily)